MKADVILKKKEDAVSPVIGVMLMLVVTIVIAAVVAAFAGGLATETEATPVVVLDADVYAKNGETSLTLRSLSGDNLKAEDTSIKIQSLEGKPLATGELTVSGYLMPGMTDTITLTKTGDINAGDYVDVIVLYNSKHIVLSKEVLVKK